MQIIYMDGQCHSVLLMDKFKRLTHEKIEIFNLGKLHNLPNNHLEYPE